MTNQETTDIDLASVDMTDVDLFAEGPPVRVVRPVRAECPVMWSDTPDGWPEKVGHGQYNLTRAADIARVSKDHETLPAHRGRIMR